MIDHFEAENCGCLKSVACDLTQIHAFIGPNDSGKTTLLRSICETVNVVAGSPYVGAPRHVDARSRLQSNGFIFTLSEHQSTISHGAEHQDLPDRVVLVSKSWPGRTSLLWARLANNLRGGAWIARFDGDALRQPSELMPPEQVSNFFFQRGRGLPGIYDLILGRGDKSFEAIQDAFYSLFPSVKRLGLLAVSKTEKTLQIELHDGTQVTADGFSEGMLYYLAFAAIAHLKRPAIIAIEEPENGLHPARIAEVMKLLRSLADQGTQILIATHSPLVVNELAPEEVSVVTRSPESGTRITALAKTSNFAERSKVYALGELWLSYADGTNESALLNGGSAKAVSTP